MKKAIIIGSGFSGISAASFMAKAGWDVTVLEKHDIPGGRARKFSVDGFTFDMGPSWYWMPDVFEKYFDNFGKKVSDYYELTRLSPSYRVYWKGSKADIPNRYEELKKLFESIEKGSAVQLDRFLKEAEYKYRIGMNKLVYKPGKSVLDFIDADIFKGLGKLDIFKNMRSHINKYFKHPKLRQLMEFPILFLGALPQKIPALYSLMNYADIKLGTWFPKGGMYSIVDGMYNLAKELGVKFLFNHDVTEIKIENGKATQVVCDTTDLGQPTTDHKSPIINTQYLNADIIISSADYHFTEKKLLAEKYQSYSDKYWDKRVMAPSCLLYFVGINKKLKNITHHSLFFDADFDQHGKEIYTNIQWPTDPLFYVSCTSVTDAPSAPPGCENLFFLIPVAAGLHGDSDENREKYFQKIIDRFEKQIGERMKENIVYKKSFSVSDFVNDYNSFKGNAYGLANTLLQTAIFKPKIRSKKVKNLYYTGQLTVPGPGVPPSLISGEVVAKEVLKHF